LGVLCLFAAISILRTSKLPKIITFAIVVTSLLVLLNGLGVYLVVSSNGDVLGSSWFYPFEVIHKIIPTDVVVSKSRAGKGAIYALPLANSVLLLVATLIKEGPWRRPSKES
jgi:hypothetical protein